MMRLPICGFARRVEDTVGRAMAILNTRPDYTAGPQAIRLSIPASKSRRSDDWREQ